MGRILTIVFLFLSQFQLWSQSTIVEYEVQSLFGNIGREVLIFNAVDSYYFDYVERDNKDVKLILENYDISRGGEKSFKSLKDPQTIYRIKAYPGAGRNQSLIRDEIPEISWTVNTKESKSILKFKCFAAEGTFRGRKYHVWFTPEIPSSLGPWKLSGLPGTILGAEDEMGVYKYQAIKVIESSSEQIPHAVLEFVEGTREADVKSYRDYTDKFLQEMKKRQQQQIASLPVSENGQVEAGSIRTLLREISFEWEPQDTQELERDKVVKELRKIEGVKKETLSEY